MSEGATSGDVTLPAVGKVRKIYVVVGGLVVLGAAVLYARNRKAAAAASSSTSSTIDPQTGLTAGSPEDLAALANLSTYQTGFGGGGSGGGSTTIGGQVSNGPPFSDNAAWSQYVTSYLIGLPNGPDSGTVAAALGAYLSGGQVNLAQRDIINEAIAYGDQPPVAGPHGYPPSINLVQSPGNPNPPPAGTPPPASGHTDIHTEVQDGKSVDELVGFWHITRDQLFTWNPPLAGVVLKYKAGKGYGNWPGAIDALNVSQLVGAGHTYTAKVGEQ